MLNGFRVPFPVLIVSASAAQENNAWWPLQILPKGIARTVSQHEFPQPRLATQGTSAKVAREIRETIEKSAVNKSPRFDWVITHAWSYFSKSPGNDENAENTDQAKASAQGGVLGYTPAVWCAERLPSNIRVVVRRNGSGVFG